MSSSSNLSLSKGKIFLGVAVLIFAILYVWLTGDNPNAIEMDVIREVAWESLDASDQELVSVVDGNTVLTYFTDIDREVEIGNMSFVDKLRLSLPKSNNIVEVRFEIQDELKIVYVNPYSNLVIGSTVMPVLSF